MKWNALTLLFAGLVGCSAPALSPRPDQTQAPTDSYEKRLEVTHGNYCLVVYSMPSVDVMVPTCNCLRGPTLHARIISLRTGLDVATFGGGSEADPDVIVDFSQAPEGLYRFTDCTWDPRDGNQVPFVVRSVQIRADGSVAQKDEIVLKAEAGDQARIDELVRQTIQESDSNADDKTEYRRGEAMGHIRNIGIGNPDMALAAFAKLRGKEVDGWVLEEKIDRENEIVRVKKLKSGAGGQGH